MRQRDQSAKEVPGAVNDSLHPSHRVRFGLFEVDLRTGELWRSGRKLKLTGQPFSVLAILLERPGEVITREEVQRRLWPDTFVDVDHNLNAAINKLRETLADSAEKPRFVETLSRRGYRFIAPIQIAAPQTGAPSGGNTVHLVSRQKNSLHTHAEDGFWVAVLPLASSDAEKDLADRAVSLAEEIVTGLSRFSYLRVISLSSTFTIPRRIGRRASSGQGTRGTVCTRGQPSPSRRQGAPLGASGGLCFRSSSLGRNLPPALRRAGCF